MSDSRHTQRWRRIATSRSEAELCRNMANKNEFYFLATNEHVFFLLRIFFFLPHDSSAVVTMANWKQFETNFMIVGCLYDTITSILWSCCTKHMAKKSWVMSHNTLNINIYSSKVLTTISPHSLLSIDYNHTTISNFTRWHKLNNFFKD